MKSRLFVALLSVGCALLARPAFAEVLRPCPPGAFVTLESGKLAGVDWVEHSPQTVSSRSRLTQSMELDASLRLRPDGSTASSSLVIATALGATEPRVKTFKPGVLAWSDMIPSSVEEVVRYALLTGRTRVQVESPFSSRSGLAMVQRLDDTDWTLSYHNKRYEVLTDEHGCMRAASLPDYGVVIERRSSFATSAYPFWAPYAAPPDRAYDVRDVRIEAGGHTLAGTLTIPAHGQRYPAVVLVTGLSPHERNNGDPPWMTLRDIADTLTRAGIATLRADDRGVGGSTGSQQTYTTFAKVADIRRLVNWLRSQPSVDHVGIAGYSEGGLVAIMAAAADSKIAAIATLAAPGVSGEQVARYQITLGVDNDPTIPKADRAKAIAQQLAEPLTAHERSYLSIEPLRYARAVRCPALIMQGSTDFNVPTRSSERLAEAMREAGNTDVSVMLYPDVSHSFLPDTFGLPADWPYLPGFLTTPGALDELTRWFAQRLLVSP